jgi:hypothetical protein
MASLPAFFLTNPVARSFVIIDRFNVPRDYTYAPQRLQLHEGIDLRAVDDRGNPVAVLAAQRGIVDQVGFTAQGYGNYVRISHPWGSQRYVTWYGHMSEIHIEKGAFVLAGQKLGIAGTTGYSNGIHLHITLQYIGHGLQNYVVADVVDPEPYFKLSGVPLFDEAWYVEDVTIPDGTVMEPGHNFDKVWRMRNTGTTTWKDGYKLAYVKDDQMGGPNDTPLTSLPVEPGQLTNVAVRLTAPSQAGVRRSTWQIKNRDNQVFPQEVYAEVDVRVTQAFDQASYVADVTIPDGTVVQPGASFLKTWRLRNSGTTTWTTNYSLRFVSDNRMSGPASVSLPRNVAPGEIVEISARLIAPQDAGRQRSTWKLHNAAGKPFDYGMYAEIQVPESPPPVTKLSEARYVADMTIPDGTVIQPGDTFVKTWRIRNSGETTWGTGYTLAFFGDEQMGAPDSVPLPAARPGDVVDVSVTLRAPEAAGVHRTTWKARDPQKKFFEFDMFALIAVPEREQPTREVNELSYVADVTIPDGTVVKPGEKFVKTWRVRNTGTSAWGAGYKLAYFGDNKMDGPDAVALAPLKPGEVTDVSLMLTAPKTSGMSKSTWKARDPQGKVFEHYLFALVDVIDPTQRFDMLSYVRGDGRLYDLQFNWSGGGTQRLQTQVDGTRFYHVKYSEWEEFWYDDLFIYRGTDTSPGKGEVYTLYENGQYGSPWLPRKMTIGVPFRRTPLVVFRRKSDGTLVPGKTFIQITWIQLEAIHSRLKLASGIEIANVAVLAAMEDDGGKPRSTPFERYYYAQKYGLVQWEGSLGRSTLVNEFKPGTAPDNVREVLPWLAR